MILEVQNRSGKKQFVVMAMTQMEKKAFQAWKSMIGRCTNTGHTAYEEYGGRGIKICERWLESFQNFFADVGLPPGPEYSIDRTDCNGNYEPGDLDGKPKVKWALLEEQHRNRRNTRWVTIKFPDAHEETKPMAAWAKQAGISTVLMHKRLEYGMTNMELLRPAGYNVKLFDTGDGMMMNCYEISQKVGCSQACIWLRIKRGIRGAELLEPSRTKHHKGFREPSKIMLTTGKIVDRKSP